MKHDVSIDKVAALVSTQLPKGIFLCVGGEKPNVMTIGWGGLSFYWGRDVFVVPVRQQRFTYPLLQAEQAFTVCVPHSGAMKEALLQAGTLSGHDGNKFEAMGLETVPGRKVNAPVIPGCAYVLECVTRAQNDFTAPKTDDSIIDYTYKAGDFHTLFYGEIVACYAGE